MDPTAWQLWLDDNPLGFAVSFFALWALVSFVFSRLTGWAELAESYRTDEKSQTKLIQAVQVSWGSFFLQGNIYTIGSTDKGMYLGVLFPFRFGHPPLLIPWHDIKARPVRRFLANNVELQLGGSAPRPFEIRRKVAEQLKERSNGRFSF